LNLSEYESSVLRELLANDARRSEREETAGSPWAEAVSRIRARLDGVAHVHTDGSSRGGDDA
jgi:hypothetical protein